MRSLGFALLLLVAAFFLQSAKSDICPRQHARTIGCHNNRYPKRCGDYSLKSYPSTARYGSASAIVEIPQNSSCSLVEMAISDDFSSEFNHFDASFKWKVKFPQPDQVNENSTFVMVTSSNEAVFQKESVSKDAYLILLSYISHGISLQFFGLGHRRTSTRKTITKLVPAVSGINTAEITINMTGDHELDKFALQRYYLLTHSTKLFCVQKRNGGWTEQGCRTKNSTTLEITCNCDFEDGIEYSAVGVLTTSKALPGSLPAMPLYFGLTILSTLFIALTLFLLLRFRKSLRDPNRRFEVQINLTISLLLRHTFLLMGFGYSLISPLNRRGCEAMAVLHMYFLITTVLWVLVEGIIIYRKVCKSSLTQPLRNVIITMILVWGMPMILLAAVSSYELINNRFIRETESYSVVKERLQSVISNPNIVESEMLNYRKYDACWTTSEFASFAIGIPVTISLVVNTIILIWVGIVVWKIRGVDQKNTPEALRKENGTQRQTISTFRAVAILTAVLGIPWLFSLFYNLVEGIEKSYSLAPSYIHFVCVFLQGPALFYLYCIQNQEFRRVIRRQVKANKIKNSIITQNRLHTNSV